ncbi:MAG TPA: calcium-binding protein [Dongiaceae bacterium]|nr:calcium-binding protein [Dongiaceae bacterium]
MATIKQSSAYLDPNLLGQADDVSYTTHSTIDTGALADVGGLTLDPDPSTTPTYHYVLGDAGNNALNGTAQADAMYGLDGNDTLKGLLGDDLLDGGNGNDNLQGGAGNDFMLGDAGDDRLDGGAGDDTLYGGDGNDTFVGGAGNDYIDGGLGSHDLVDFSQSTGGVAVSLKDGHGYGGNADSAGDTYKNIEDINGSSHDDTLDGDASAYGNAINGGAGDDNIHGNGGFDTLHGNDGNDTITAYGTWNTGGAGMYGDAGNDRLYGGADDDYMYGGTGDDYLTPGGGVNFLTGGAGHDTFDIQKNLPQSGPVNPLDVIKDFDKGDDILSLFDSFQGLHNNTPVTVGADANGDVQLTFNNTTVVLEGVHNAGWHSTQDLTNAGFNVQETHW